MIKVYVLLDDRHYGPVEARHYSLEELAGKIVLTINMNNGGKLVYINPTHFRVIES